jgi:hypothetical protein
MRGREREQKDTDHLITFKQHDATTLVTCGEIVSGGIKLHGRDDVGWIREQ